MAKTSRGSVKILPADFSDAVRQTRREARLTITLPLRLTTGFGEMIPAVIVDLSASGLSALADVRSSPLLPPPRGARFEGEFFLDEIEVRQAILEIVQVEERGNHLIALGCTFVHHSPQTPTLIRAKIAARLAALPH